MKHLVTVGIYLPVFGLTILIGGILSRLDSLPDNEMKKKIFHSIIAFGGGVLIAAIAFALTHHAIELLSVNHINPMSAMQDHWSPAPGASLGFLVGMIRKKLVWQNGSAYTGYPANNCYLLAFTARFSDFQSQVSKD